MAYGTANGFSALGDPTRRAIFERLAGRPRSVGELAAELPVSRPAVSQHLKVLRDGGLVVSQPEGTRRIYRLNPHGVGALRTWLEGVWDQALTDFHKVAEQTAADNRFADPSAEGLHPEQEQP
jgi:DNA-binding transcriptional ArsR family regulator